MEESAKKKSHKMLYIGIGAIIVIAVAYFLASGLIGGSNMYGQPVPASQISALYALANNNILASDIGTTAYAGLNPSQYIKKINLTALKQNGMPEVIYIGAEYCPFCAATRWALILTLMRFGNLNNLKYTGSSPTDRFPNTPTFSFVGYNYSSNYLAFVAIETQDRFNKPLQNLTGTPASIFNAYATGIPFLDFGNLYVESGSLVGADILAGKSWSSITSSIGIENTPISQEAVSAANIYTAQICRIINNTAPVCSQNYVKQAESRFAT